MRQLTHVTSSSPYSADVNHPVWAPDAKRIVFEVHNSRLGEPAKHRALFVINADGSESRQLTPWSLDAGDPDWSPDGRLILFRSVSGREQHGNLYTVSPDGSGLKQLTRYPFPKAVFSGSFSPDGKWITFSRFKVNDPYPAVFVMRVNGTGVRQVSRGGYNVAPDWGPAR
jgi:Tol biopolymer transport system component